MTISIVNGVCTIFVPATFDGYTLVTRGEFRSVKRTAAVGTEYCFEAEVDGAFFSSECITTQ